MKGEGLKKRMRMMGVIERGKMCMDGWMDGMLGRSVTEFKGLPYKQSLLGTVTERLCTCACACMAPIPS